MLSISFLLSGLGVLMGVNFTPLITPLNLMKIQIELFFVLLSQSIITCRCDLNFLFASPSRQYSVATRQNT
jgi:hypothetical protein